jgi:hypothetical protein
VSALSVSWEVEECGVRELNRVGTVCGEAMASV